MLFCNNWILITDNLLEVSFNYLAIVINNIVLMMIIISSFRVWKQEIGVWLKCIIGCDVMFCSLIRKILFGI